MSAEEQGSRAGRTGHEGDGDVSGRLSTQGRPTGPGGSDSDAGAGGAGDAGQLQRTGVQQQGGGEVDMMPPRVEDVDRRAERKAERQVAFCFLLTAVCSLVFVFAYFAFEPNEIITVLGAPLYPQTTLFALSMGVGLFAIGAGPVLWAKKLMPDEEAVQEREPFHSKDEDSEAAAQVLTEGFEATGFQRRTLVRTSLLLGAGSLALPAAVPLLSLGRWQFKEEALYTTEWDEGRHLVTENLQRVRADALSEGGIETVFPEPEAEGPEEEAHISLVTKSDAAVILIRMKPDEIIARDGREDWSVNGVVAYSKICTHMGCPVALYEQQTHHLLCPCHQSVFLATDGCRPIFGPATRSLPQLPLGVDEDGFLVARSDFLEPTGPAFWERDSEAPSPEEIAEV